MIAKLFVKWNVRCTDEETDGKCQYEIPFEETECFG
jgi:hypothetical protein